MSLLNFVSSSSCLPTTVPTSRRTSSSSSSSSSTCANTRYSVVSSTRDALSTSTSTRTGTSFGTNYCTPLTTRRMSGRVPKAVQAPPSSTSPKPSSFSFSSPPSPSSSPPSPSHAHPPPPPPPPHISSADELDAAIVAHDDQLPTVTIIKVYSKACRSCKRIERPYARLAAKYSAQHTDAVVHCWQLCADHDLQHQALAQSLGVRGFPTFVFYRDGKRIDHVASSCADTIEQTLIDLL